MYPLAPTMRIRMARVWVAASRGRSARGWSASSASDQLVADLEHLDGTFVGLARPEGFEPPTPWSEATCSGPLSYGRADRG